MNMEGSMIQIWKFIIIGVNAEQSKYIISWERWKVKGGHIFTLKAFV